VKKRIAIIGGGITGLTTAYKLEQHNQQCNNPMEVFLIEKGKVLGGKVRTEYQNGFVLEGGPDSFISSKPWVLSLSKELGIESEIFPCNTENTNSYILSDQKIHHIPNGLAMLMPTDFMSFAVNPIISWKGKLRAACDLLIPKKKELSDETLSSFITRRLGREMLEKVVGPLVGGIHSNNPETMSLLTTFPRFLEMERQDRSIILSMLRSKKKFKLVSKTKSVYKSPFLTFKNGMKTLITALHKQLTTTKILTETEVIGLQEEVDSSYIILFKNGNKLAADAVVFAIDSNRTANILKNMDENIAKLLCEIPFTSSASISLGYKKGEIMHIPEGFGITIPARENRKISAITFSSQKWGNRVPNNDFSLIRVFIGGYNNPELVLLEDNSLMKIVKEELKDIIGITAEPYLIQINRWKDGRPQYTIGHLDRVKEIKERLELHSSLYLAGSSYQGSGLSDCIYSGVQTAQTILERFQLDVLTTVETESQVKEREISESTFI
jgi:oxygen-dependent protoporphyrinogen oxidase